MKLTVFDLPGEQQRAIGQLVHPGRRPRPIHLIRAIRRLAEK